MNSSLLLSQKYESEIQSIWDNSCTGYCHNSNNNSGGLNLSRGVSYSALVNVASKGSSGFLLVKPGDIINSVLFQKVVGNNSFGERMPKGGSSLSQADENKIKEWIENDALMEWELSIDTIIPSFFELSQNTPNPFNPVTNIRISLAEDANITLKVYNLLGEEMNILASNRFLNKGKHSFNWLGVNDQGLKLPSGVYLYNLEVTSMSGGYLYHNTKKMILMK